MDTTSFSRPRGFSDYSGPTVRLHRWIESTLLEVLERAGFDEVRLPSLEYVDLYHPDRLGALFHDLVAARITEPAVFATGSGRESQGEPGQRYTRSTNDVVLRPEFTAPVARHVTGRILEEGRPQYLPIRISYAGEVFRNVRPGPLRSREFRQVGAELVGCSGPLADLEALDLACDAAVALGLPDWTLHLGHAAVFRGLLQDLGLEGETLYAVASDLELRDRLQWRLRASDEAVLSYTAGFVPQLKDSLVEAKKRAGDDEPLLAELSQPQDVPASYWREALPRFHAEKVRLVWRHNYHLDDAMIEAALGVGDLAGDRDDFFLRVEKRKPSSRLVPMIHHLRWLSEQLPGNVLITPAASRGIGYYTGVTFEIHTLATTAAYTDICGGGRYDDLYKWVYDRARSTQSARGSRLAPTVAIESLTAVGFAFGVERIAAAISSRTERSPRIFVAVQHPDLSRHAYDFSRNLRRRGVPCECHIADALDGDTLREQMGHAERVDAAYVVIFGESEWREGTVALRDMNEASQRALPLAEVEQRLAKWASDGTEGCK